MTDNLKLEGTVSLDVTDAAKALGTVEQSAGRMAQSVAKAGEQAQQGVQGINTATKDLTQTQSRFLEQLKRNAIVATEGRAAFLEQRAAMLGVSQESASYIARLREVENGQGKAASSASAFGRALEGAKGTALTLGAALGVGLAGILSARAFVGFIADTIEATGKLADLSIQTGATVEALSGLQEIGRLSDTGIETIADSINKLSKNLAGVSDESKGAGKALEAIGIDVAKFKQLAPEEQFLTLAKSMDQFQDGSGKSAVAMALLGKEGAKLLPLMKDVAAAGELGAQVTKEQSDQADAFGDNLTRLRVNSDAWKKELTLGMLPALNTAAQAFVDVTSGAGGVREEVRKLSKDGSIAEWTRQSVVGVTYLLDALTGVKRSIEVVGAYLGALVASAVEGFTSLGRAQRAVMTGDFASALSAARGGVEKQKEIWASLGQTIETTLGEKTFGQKVRERMADLGKLGATADAVKPKVDFSSELDKNAKAAKKAADEFEQLWARLNGLETGTDPDFIKNLMLLAVEGKKAGKSMEEIVKAQERYIAQQPYMKEQAKLQKEAAKAANDWLDVELKRVLAYEKSVAGMADQNRSLEEEIDKLGLSKEQQIQYTIAKNESAIAIKEEQLARIGNGETMTREAIALQEEIRLLRERNSLLRRKGDKEAAIELGDEMKKQAKRSADEWERTSEQIGQSFVDNLMQGGKSVAQYLKDLFRTLVLQPILKPIGQAVGGVASSLLGGPAAASDGGGGGGMVSSLISGASSLFGGGGIASAVLGGGATGGLSTAAFGLVTSIPVVGWIAAAVAIIASIVSKRGETRSGGQYNFGELIAAPSGGELKEGGQAAALTARGIDSILETLGSSSRLTNFMTGLEQSEKGKGFAYAGGTLNTGQAFGQGWGDAFATPGYMNRRGNLSAEEAVKAFSEELKQATLQAIQSATDIPESVARILRDKDIDSLAGAELDELLNQVNAVIAAVDGFRQAVVQLPFKELEALSFDAASSLIDFAGGLDNVVNGLSAYYKNFYSAEEQRLNTAENIQRRLAAGGIELSSEQILGTTRDQFRELGDSFLGKSDEASLKAMAAIIAVSEAMFSIIPPAEAATDSIKEMADATADAAEQAKIAAEAAAEAAARAIESALDGLSRAVDMERSFAQASLDAASAQAESLRGLLDVLRGAVRDIRGGVESTRTQSAAQGQAFIAIALARAQAGGSLPDSGQLQDAIGAARGGLGESQFRTAFERDRAQLILAGKLAKLQELAEPQLTAAEQQVKFAQDQLDYLDALMQSAQDQVDALNGIDTSVLSVAEAVDRLAAALGKPLNTPPKPSASTGGGASFGPSFATGNFPPPDPNVPQLGLATGPVVLTGPVIQPPTATGAVFGGGPTLTAEILKALEDTAKASKSTADTLTRVTRDGNSLNTTPA